MADRATTTRARVPGIILQLRRDQPGNDSVDLRIDYSSFQNYVGGGYAGRLKLVTLPACALTTPTRPACQVQTPLPASNDATHHTLSTAMVATAPATSPSLSARPATLPAKAGSRVVVAAVSGASGTNGSFTATSLAPSGTWSAGGASGSFTWSYPISLPPAPAASGAAPAVSLNYNSATVDGRVATANAQSTAIGEGWDYSPGFIERTYQPCTDNIVLPSANRTSDQCWAGQILSYSVNGSSNSIVRDDSTGTYRLKDDDGSRVELIGAGTAAYQGEYWRVTDTEGVQYFFGRTSLPDGTANDATWTVPVCGDADTACAAQGTSGVTPLQMQAWRWNLDYVLDTNNNATVYRYTSEDNYYGQNNQTTPALYDRSGYLTEIDYGIRASTTTLSAPADKVLFTTAERCMTTCATFDAAHAANWPDTPQDQNCASTGTCNNHAPTFWSRKRTTTITTQFNDNGTFRAVDTYALAQSFPSTGDPELELDSITRTATSWSGTTATNLPLPAVSFIYQLLDNRVNGYNAQPAMLMWRLRQVNTETGQQLAVSYDQAGRAPAQCTKTTVPSDPSQDTSECYPVYWTPPGHTGPELDWFHKHVVTQVDVSDANGVSPVRSTTYTYIGSPAWHYDDNEVTRPKYRTYGQFRGFQKVQVRTGNPNHASNGVADAWTLSTTIYYRGMDGDILPANGHRSASVTDSLGTSVVDSDFYAGTARETQTFNGDTSVEVSATITTMATQGSTATHARAGLNDLVARYVAPRVSTAYTDLAAGGTRQITNSYDYDTLGRAIHLTESGTSVTTRCTTTDYADNTTTWTRSLASEVRVSAQTCPTGSTQPTGILSDTQTYYDSSTTLGTVSAGNPTKISVLTSTNKWSSTTTHYDALGRIDTVTVDPTNPSDNPNGLNRVTNTTYTQAPATTGPVTAITVENPVGQQTKATIDPSRGSVLSQTDVAGRVTSASYDPVGRVTSVWEPGHVKGTNPASTTYSYVYGPSAPLAVTTNTLIDRGNHTTAGYVTSISLYDANGQLRQTQTAAVGGDRNIADVFTDGHGWVVQTNGHWHTTGNPATNIVTAAQSGIEQSTRTVYDGTGRAITATQYNGTTAKRTTNTVYSGDSVTVVPPAGSVETTSRTDARGNQTELDQWTTAPVINADNTLTGGTAVITKYTYDILNRLQSTQSPYGGATPPTWTNTYDLGGRVIQTTDPDAGTTTRRYTPAGDLEETTDANGTHTAYTYDALGRKIGLYAGDDATAPITASWTYDVIGVNTAAPGSLTSSTRYVHHGSNPDDTYTESVTGFDTYGNPLGTKLSMSTPDTGFAASYTTKQTWTTTHLPTTMVPATGSDLPAETIQYFYDTFGNPTGTTGYSAYVSAATYTAYGEPSQYTVGVNAQTSWLTYSRDAETRRITGVNVSTQAATPQLDNTTYTYDPSGNIVKSVDTEGPSGSVTQTQCNQYDALVQLIESWSATDDCAVDPNPDPNTETDNSNATVGGPQPYWLTWALDNAGGRKTQTNHVVTGGTLTSDATTTYTNGVTVTNNTHAHALASAATTGGVSATSNYTYDKNGRTLTATNTSAGTQTFAYTPDGLVDSITKPGSNTVSYIRDADGNVILRRDGTTTTLYLPGEELSKNTADSSAISGTRYYVHNGQTIALRKGGGNAVFLFGDLQGTASIAAQTTTSGIGTVTRRHFDPYGNPLANSGGGLITGATWPDDHTFLGHPTSTTTALTDLGARQYDPTTGRFLSVDPILDLASPQQMNGYNYGNNDPVNKTDPDGTKPRCAEEGTCAQTTAPSGAITTTPAAKKKATAPDPDLVDQDLEALARGEDPGAAAIYPSPLGNLARDPAANRRIIASYSAAVVIFDRMVRRGDIWKRDGVWLIKIMGIAPSGAWNGIVSLYRTGRALPLDLLVGRDGSPSGKASGRSDSTGNDSPLAADTADGAAGAGRADTAAKSCLNSFTADTSVTLADSTTKPIKNVKVGDKVLATDPETGETRAEPVEQLIRHSGRHAMVLVSLADGSVLDSTDGHPIWDATTGRFTTAADLHVGDKIETTGGTLITISALTGYTADLTAYNLQVSTIHTYYAGSTPVLVHNSCNVPSDSDLGQVISRGGRTSTDQQAIFRQLEQQHGLDPRVASERLHAIKSGVENNRDVIFTRSGGVYDSTSGDHLGDLLQG